MKVTDCIPDQAEADHLGETLTGQELHVKDLLHGTLELQERHDLAAAHVHCRHAAFQLLPAFGQGDAVHCGS